MPKSKKRSLKLNIVASMMIQVVSLLVNLISKRAVRFYLGVEYLGMQSIYSNFCDVLSFAFFGVGTVMMFSLYGPFAREDKKEIAKYYQYYDRLYRKITWIVLAGGILSTLLVLFAVNADIGILEICVTYLTFMLSVVVYNRQLVRNFFIQADQRRYVVALINGGIDVAALIGEIYVLKYSHSYQLFVLCILLKNLIINFVLKRYLKKNDAYIFAPCEEIASKEKKRIRSNAKDMMLYRFGKVLISNTDSIFISRFTSTMLVGIYSNYQFVILGIQSMIGALFEAVRGRVGHNLQINDMEEQYRGFQNYLFVNAWLMGCFLVGFYFLIEDFIFLWMGSVQPLSKEAIVLIMVNFYLEDSQSVIRTYRETAGIFHNIRTMILAKGILNIILSLILGKIWGLMGVLGATAIASVVTLFWYEPGIMYAYFQKSLWNEVRYHVISLFLLAVSFGATDFAVSCIEGKGIFSFLLKGAVCVTIVSVVYGTVLGIRFIAKGKKNEGSFL